MTSFYAQQELSAAVKQTNSRFRKTENYVEIMDIAKRRKKKNEKIEFPQTATKTCGRYLYGIVVTRAECFSFESQHFHTQPFQDRKPIRVR